MKTITKGIIEFLFKMKKIFSFFNFFILEKHIFFEFDNFKNYFNYKLNFLIRNITKR